MDNDIVLRSSHYGLESFRAPSQRLAAVRINERCFKTLARNLRNFFTATWLDWITLLIIGAIEAAVRDP